MRLTCPNCEAVYEVPDGAVPTGGREVQCTNCGHSWYATGPRLSRGGDDDEPEMPVVAPRTPVDPRLRKVLREEAEREVEARRRERGEEPMGDDPAPRPTPGEGERATPRHPSETRSGELPRLNEPGPNTARVATSSRRPRERRSGGLGFALGFVASLVIAALLLAAYVEAPRIAAAVPQLAEPLEDYAAAVDDGRVALDAAARDAADRVADIFPEAEGG